MSINTYIQGTSLQMTMSPLQIVFDVVPDLVIFIEEKGIILDFKVDQNHEFSPFSGISLEKNIQEFLPLAIRNQADQIIEKVIRTQKTISLNFSLELDSKELWFEARFSPIENRHIIIVIKDITEEKQKEKQLQRQLNWLAAIRAIDFMITSSTDLVLTLSRILTHATTQLEVDAADILTIDDNGTNLEFSVSFGFRTRIPENHSVRLGVGSAGKAALERRILHNTALPNHQNDLMYSPIFSQEGFVDYYAVPLIAKGDLKGVLEIFHRSPIQSDTEWLNFLETLGKQAAIAIDNAMLFKDKQYSAAEIEQAYDTTIEGWSHALDLRDKETDEDRRRVSSMTLNLARMMNYPDEKLIHLQRGATLHDIGNMGIPDNILFKPGSLTPKEWEVVRQHPQNALQILSPIRYLKPALDIPLYHHEKWDGSGYPHGLKGTQIPLAARIFSVVDVYNSLTSDRPYRSAWSHEDAKNYIESESGVHFDPEIVACYSKLLNEI